MDKEKEEKVLKREEKLDKMKHRRGKAPRAAIKSAYNPMGGIPL